MQLFLSTVHLSSLSWLFSPVVQLFQLFRLVVLHRLCHAGHGAAQTGRPTFPPSSFYHCLVPYLPPLSSYFHFSSFLFFRPSLFFISFTILPFQLPFIPPSFALFLFNSYLICGFYLSSFSHHPPPTLTSGFFPLSIFPPLVPPGFCCHGLFLCVSRVWPPC